MDSTDSFRVSKVTLQRQDTFPRVGLGKAVPPVARREFKGAGTIPLFQTLIA